MRRLAHQLGRYPMALYRYVPNRAALLDEVVELFLAQLSAPIQDLDWQAQLRSNARDFRRLALSRPHVVPLLVIRPLPPRWGCNRRGAAPGGADADPVHRRRLRSGDSPARAPGLHRLPVRPHPHRAPRTHRRPEETDDLLRLGLQRLPAREFPVLRSLASALAGYDGAAELDQSLDTLLAGLDAQLATQSGTVGI